MKQANQPVTSQPAMQRRKLLGAAGTTGALAVAATWLAGRESEPDAIRLELTLLGVPPGTVHSVFILGGGNSIETFESAGSGCKS